jgi:hypothetical protein
MATGEAAGTAAAMAVRAGFHPPGSTSTACARASSPKARSSIADECPVGGRSSRLDAAAAAMVRVPLRSVNRART